VLVTVLITLAAEGRLVRVLADFAQLDSLRIIFTSPRTHARISINEFSGKHDSKSVQADYHSNEPPPEWVTERTKQPPLAQSATESPRLKRSTEMNALPILYIGALLAGKIDEMPKMGQQAADPLGASAQQSSGA